MGETLSLVYNLNLNCLSFSHADRWGKLLHFTKNLLSHFLVAFNLLLFPPLFILHSVLSCDLAKCYLHGWKSVEVEERHTKISLGGEILLRMFVEFEQFYTFCLARGHATHAAMFSTLYLHVYLILLRNFEANRSTTSSNFLLHYFLLLVTLVGNFA